MHQRSHSMRLDSHISLGLNRCVQVKQKDSRSEENSKTGHGSGRTVATIKEHEEENPLVSLWQKRGLIMAMDPRSGGNGRGVVGIKNGYSLAPQGAWEQSQRAFVLRSMFMRAIASSSSDPTMRYIIMGCAICWRLLLLGHQQWQPPWLLLLQLLLRCPTIHAGLGIRGTQRRPKFTSMAFFLQKRKRHHHHHHHHHRWGLVFGCLFPSNWLQIHSILLLPFEMQSHAFDRFLFTRCTPSNITSLMMSCILFGSAFFRRFFRSMSILATFSFAPI